MTNNFLNRLVGMIVIFTVAIIILPILLDGKKKYNDNRFTVIPLLNNKVSDEYRIKMISTINFKQLTKPVDNSISEVIVSDNIYDTNSKFKNDTFIENRANTKSVLITKKNINFNKKTKTLESKKDYIIQLCVLKNSIKVEEIISKLRLFGYQAYTDPLLPINGQLTRIFIGLNTSIEKLQSSLSELKDLTGLQGQIRSYREQNRFINK
ncbi:MAG: SPOR domain-containing protein [Arsenophonus sp. ER-QC15-MAG3]